MGMENDKLKEASQHNCVRRPLEVCDGRLGPRVVWCGVRACCDTIARPGDAEADERS